MDRVYKILEGLDASRAASGPDKISTLVLKTTADKLSPFLTEIFQEDPGLATGDYPVDEKNA